MQSFTTRYNVYFNGEQHYKEQLKKMEEYEDDYSDFVYVHPAESFADDKATHPSVSFDRTIEKMQKAIPSRRNRRRTAARCATRNIVII